MHELSLATQLVSQVESILRREGARRVVTVSVSIGELSGVERESFEFCFPLAARKTPVEGARLDVLEEPASVRCRGCGRTTRPDVPLILCMECGSGDVEILSGRDFILKSLEVG